MAKKPIYTVRSFVLKEGGGYVPFEDLTPEERADWEKRAQQRLQLAMDGYYSTHPEERRRILEQ